MKNLEYKRTIKEMQELSGLSEPIKRQRDKDHIGQHPFIKGLYRLFRYGGYTVYTNDTYTSGTVECPSGWVDHWIRYAQVEGCELKFGYDAPSKIGQFIRQKLQGKVTVILQQEAANE